MFNNYCRFDKNRSLLIVSSSGAVGAGSGSAGADEDEPTAWFLIKEETENGNQCGQ